MAEKDKFPGSYEDLRSEAIIKLVNEAFKNNPDNYVSELEKIGFRWEDDEENSEIEEEERAVCLNANQEYLIAYFEGHVELCREALDAFLKETRSDKPNYPLIRKYFRRGNPNLKRLLKFGIENDPVNSDLLADFSFFHEFNDILEELIELYLKACKLETNPANFEVLAKDFHSYTIADEFNALYALKEIFPSDTDKGAIVDKLIEEENSAPEDIEF